MSIDLTLLPFNNDLEPNSYSHTVLPLQTNSRDLFEDIGNLMTIESQSIEFITDQNLSGDVPKGFHSYIGRSEGGDTQYGECVTDAYGDQIRWVRASVLQGLKYHDGVIRNPLNILAWGYINALPKETKVALYWS
jgi:hypothetical protein